MSDTTCELFERDTSAYLEDELSAEARARLDAHAARCDSCAALLADLRRISAEARALPALEPSRDLWAGIEARIEAPVIPLADGAIAPQAPTRIGRPSHTWQVSTRGLAAAAVLLIALSSGLTYLVATSDDPSETGQWVVTGGGAAGVQPVRLSTPQIARYDEEIGELRRVIAERRGLLDSATVATIERSLRVIDDAIAESRAALASDPASEFLHEQLDRTLARKVELLRALARMPARS